ncbi:hypothetical protein [Microscilla marina]|uniref:Cytochrome B n=1 Tax=Microscilla marina ATCC 23134 TaxID=313606 RepID=A1ZGI2_MICM2|nr:hypothetical protein [Microscilla marina]EAY30599.1 conserved hypothetical protein [Microscilla marina ATCC 23134]
MYNTVLIIHSWLRVIILVLAVVVLFKSLMGWLNKGSYTKGDNALSASFVGFIHLQALLGFTLYFFLSPITASAMKNFGAAMKNSAVRYWAVEHILIMLIGLVVAQIGRSKAKKLTDSTAKHKTSFIFFTIAIVLIVGGIFAGAASRPWFRM